MIRASSYDHQIMKITILRIILSIWAFHTADSFTFSSSGGVTTTRRIRRKTRRTSSFPGDGTSSSSLHVSSAISASNEPLSGSGDNDSSSVSSAQQGFSLSWPEIQEIYRKANEELGISLTPPRTPKQWTFNTLLKRIAESKHPNAGPVAQEIFLQMLAIESLANRFSLNQVLVSWTKCSRDPKAAQDLLEQVKHSISPDRVSYNTILSGYASLRNAAAAQTVFDELSQRHDEANDPDLEPNIRDYSALLNAYAREGLGEEAQALLFDMKNSGTVVPNTSCFNQVLYAWAKAGDAERAQVVLELMESTQLADTRSYNIVLHALSQSKRSKNKADAPFQGDALLEQMQQLGIPPDVVTFATLINVWCSFSSKSSSFSSSSPGNNSNNNNIKQALARTEELVKQATALLPDMDANYFYSNVLYSMALCAGDASMPFQAELLIKESTKEFHAAMDISVYNALLHCWAKSKHDSSLARSLEILDRLEMDAETPNPNIQTYGIVLDKLAKQQQKGSETSSGSTLIDIAITIFEHAREKFTLNVPVYCSMIQAYARSNVPDKAFKARRLLMMLRQQFPQSKDLTLPYNAVLNACEYTASAIPSSISSQSTTSADTSPIFVNDGDSSSDDDDDPEPDLTPSEEAFSIACRTFDEMRQGGIPCDDITYASFLGVVNQQMPDSEVKDDLIKVVWKKCRLDGHVSPLVISRLQQTSASKSKDSIISTWLEGHAPNQLPPEWTRNVGKRRRL